MRRLLWTVLGVFVLPLACGSNVYGASITLDDRGVVGIADGRAGDNPGSTSMAAVAQEILDLSPAGHEGDCGTTVEPRACEAGTFFDYAGTLVGNGVKVDVASNAAGGPIPIAASYQYAFAKYDGQNAGWVLFDLADYGNVLPRFSDIVWTNKQGEGYEISSYTLFNPITVPDGGSMAMLLGAALLGLGVIRRVIG